MHWLVARATERRLESRRLLVHLHNMSKLRASVFPGKLCRVCALVMTAIVPCSSPLLASDWTTPDLGVIRSHVAALDFIIQVFAIISALGAVIDFRHHRKPWPLVIGIGGPAVVFFAYHVGNRVALVYTGLAGLVIATVWSVLAKRKTSCCCRQISLQSTITCPDCGHQKQETMPTNACLFFYECESCHSTMKPKPGDCCVFCSYGSEKCPPVQS